MRTLKTLDDYLNAFRHDLLGTWRSQGDYTLGLGFSALMWDELVFRGDGTGSYESWSALSGADSGTLLWRRESDFRISILSDPELGEEEEGDWDTINYHFFEWTGIGTILLSEVDSIEPHGFWMRPGPFRFVSQA